MRSWMSSEEGAERSHIGLKRKTVFCILRYKKLDLIRSKTLVRPGN
jgi:hypothetical protein